MDFWKICPPLIQKNVKKLTWGLNTAFMKQTIALEAESYSAGQNTFSVYVGPRFHCNFDTHPPNYMLS
jgi:hypothetical protein